MHDPASLPVRASVEARPGAARRSRHAATAALAALFAACGTVPPPESSRLPALIVVVSIDQMRGDYLERFDGLWRHGLRRLRDEGAVFTDARYSHADTVTCAGHATLATGAVPATHGIILNQWYRRDEGATAPCTFDAAASSVAYSGVPEPEGHSAHQLLAPTLGDRLRARSPGSRVVSVSMKARSAIMLAGRAGTTVLWFGTTNGWASSTAFGAAPVPEAAAWIAANPVERDAGAVWERALPAEAYRGDDDAPGERPAAGWERTFPHPLGASDASFYARWLASPFADEYLAALAVELIGALGLGRGREVDYLAVGFSALDRIGHAFGPDSHEVQDALVRLDRALGALLDGLDGRVGRGRYALALSADHGAAPIPEARRRTSGDAGRIPTRAVAAAAEQALAPFLGPGSHVARVEYTQIYLTEPARAALETRADAARALEAVRAAVRRVPGIERVFAARELRAGRTSSDAALRAAAYGHHPARSGDLMALPRPYWFFVTGPTADSGDATTHGTPYDYDTHVPLIFFGAPFAPGRHGEPVTPADLAPTLAATIGLAMPGADGRVLASALAR